MLYAVCCMLCDVCCVLHAVCCMLCAVCCVLYAVRCMLCAVCCVLCIAGQQRAGSTHPEVCESQIIIKMAPKSGFEMWVKNTSRIQYKFFLTTFMLSFCRYADYLDICAAITARVPAAGPHLDSERIPTVVVDVEHLVSSLADEVGDAFYPVLGYLVGNKAGARLPLVVGVLEGGGAPTRDNLKALCAAFGTTGAAPMLHIAGVTPEATPPPPPSPLIKETLVATLDDFRAAWKALDSGANKPAGADNVDVDTEVIDLVAVGNPHLSIDECATIASLISSEEGTSHPDVSVVATLGRQVFADAKAAGYEENTNDTIAPPFSKWRKIWMLDVFYSSTFGSSIIRFTRILFILQIRGHNGRVWLPVCERHVLVHADGARGACSIQDPHHQLGQDTPFAH